MQVNLPPDLETLVKKRPVTARLKPCPSRSWPPSNSAALAEPIVISIGGASAGHYCPVYECQRDGRDQDQGLAEIHAGYQDRA